jgi:hypothetical protein
MSHRDLADGCRVLVHWVLDRTKGEAMALTRWKYDNDYHDGLVEDPTGAWYYAADVEAVMKDLDERLAEINPDNYTHEDVIALNNSSIDVCLRIRSVLERQP